MIELNNLEVSNNIAESRFEISLGDKVAVIDYFLDEKIKRISFLHTIVPEEFSGRGIAGKLAKFAFEYAEKNGLKVISHCSYIDVYIERHPELKSLL